MAHLKSQRDQKGSFYKSSKDRNSEKLQDARGKASPAFRRRRHEEKSEASLKAAVPRDPEEPQDALEKAASNMHLLGSSASKKKER